MLISLEESFTKSADGQTIVIPYSLYATSALL